MDDRFNTTAGWVLFSGVVALGVTSVSHHYFLADKNPRPEKMGYAIAGVVSSEGGAKVEPIANRLAVADVAKGEQTFKKCTSCHTINQGGPNGIGPNLYAVVGEAIAEGAGGYAFSDALKAAGGGAKWDFDKLDKWLTNPKAFANGTKMTFAGLEDPKDRANVIAYLNTQGSNLPLPKPEAAAPAAGAAAPGAAASGAPSGAASDGAGTTPAKGGEQPAANGQITTATLPVAGTAPKPGDNKAVGTVGGATTHQ